MTALASPLDLYARGLAGHGLRLRRGDGTRAVLPIARWLAAPAAFDRVALGRATGPVLDVGCGPGRHLAALAAAGISARGIDVSAAAVTHARHAGTDVTLGSVFGPVPGSGTYATALLLDGNIGIGGDEVALLRRTRELLLPGGAVLAEVDPPGTGTRRERVRLELGTDRSGWFPWARVDADGIAAAAECANLVLRELLQAEGRWLAVLVESASADSGDRLRDLSGSLRELPAGIVP